MHARKRARTARTLVAVAAAVGAGVAGAVLLRKLAARRSGAELQPAGRPQPVKLHQAKEGPRVDPGDKVEEASYESFPASDPPSFSPSTVGTRRGADEYLNG